MKFRWVTKLLILVAAPFVLMGCKDDDPDKSFTECCSQIFVSTGDYTLFLANAYSPNGDGLNDDLYIVTDSTMGVRRITNFTARRASNNDKVLEIAVMLDSKEQIRNKWNFIDGTGKPMWEDFIVSFTVTDTSGIDHSVQTRITSFECPSSSKYGEENLSDCLFTDQIDPTEGFTRATVEPRCE